MYIFKKVRIKMSSTRIIINIHYPEEIYKVVTNWIRKVSWEKHKGKKIKEKIK